MILLLLAHLSDGSSANMDDQKVIPNATVTVVAKNGTGPKKLSKVKGKTGKNKRGNNYL